MREFSFNKTSQRYRIVSGPAKGQFVSAEAVKSLTEKYIEQGKQVTRETANQLLQRKIDVAEWETTIATQLKELHINSYLLGIGGQKMMTQRDYGIIGLRLAGEYEYLRGFSQDILAGKLSEAQIKARLELYINALGGTYERARLEAHKREGYAWKRRIRNAKESCIPCIGYADRGWVAIDDGTLPPPAVNCDCKSSCKCTLRFSKAEGKPADSLASTRWGFVGYSLLADLVVNRA